MGWVRRTEQPRLAPRGARHTCACPVRELVYRSPERDTTGHPIPARDLTERVPDGRPGDLWRCDACGHLWEARSPDPFRTPYLAWLPAPWWLRLKYWRR